MKVVPRGYKHNLIQSLNQLVVSLSHIINEHKQNPKREKRFFFHWTPGGEKKLIILIISIKRAVPGNLNELLWPTPKRVDSDALLIDLSLLYRL